MMLLMKKIFIYILLCLFFVPYFLITAVICLYCRYSFSANSRSARLVWGPSPIINYKYWSLSMKLAGYTSQTYMYSYYSSINAKDDYDEYCFLRLKYLPNFLKIPLLFWESLIRFDVFIISFDGWLLGRTPLRSFEHLFFKWAGKKSVVIPYGSDAYVYNKIRSTTLMHALMLSYPQFSRQQGRIERQVQLWTKHADCVLPGVMGFDGIGRWDVLASSSLVVDTNQWKPTQKKTAENNGINGEVTIVHAPNHTGFKGTEFVIEAIEALQKEGFKIKFILLQNIQNEEVKRILSEDADILVEQLICTGHGINAVEGMASGIPVISNLEDEVYTKIFRRWAYLDECPIVSASPETIQNVLRKLILNPELRLSIGKSSRLYAEKYCSLNSAQFLFTNILKYIYKERESIINLYHPLLSEYNKRLPKIEHPLVKNRIVDL